MRKVLLVMLLIVSVSFAQDKSKIEADAKPLIEQLKTLKASIYDYKKAVSETEEQIVKLNEQLADLQSKYNAILEDEKKTKK